MTQTRWHRAFAPAKQLLPAWIHRPVRSLATMLATPVWWGRRTGFFRSCWRGLAVDRRGRPLPWYTYSCIDFLKYRRYDGASVLEFGSGQSTLWWAARAARVVAMEGDAAWLARMRRVAPPNVTLHAVSMASREDNVRDVTDALRAAGDPAFQVVVIDGCFRHEMIPIALAHLADDGMLVCDNSDAYDFQKRLTESGLLRADFYGHVPGVVLPQCTSIYFRPSCPWFHAQRPIIVPAYDKDN